eukprot:50679-Eustigmatos_ZCMA.PRE.1
MDAGQWKQAVDGMGWNMDTHARSMVSTHISCCDGVVVRAWCEHGPYSPGTLLVPPGPRG